jgi:branched-chain amino acid transport system ATP-binding protein
MKDSSDTREVVLKVESVSRSFGGVRALTNVGFSLRAGEVFGLIGPNGAGKSTLIDIVSGATRADSGRVSIGETRLTGMSAPSIARLGIARTYQVVRPLRDLTVVENVMIGALFGTHRIQSTRGARRLSLEMLDRVGLSHRALAECREISTGEMKKMDLARALAMGPRILLLDEPLAGVGMVESAGFADLLRSLVSEGMSLVLIEHALRMVWDLSDTMIVLDHGQKIAEGTPQMVADDPTVISAYLGEEWVRSAGMEAAPDVAMRT